MSASREKNKRKELAQNAATEATAKTGKVGMSKGLKTTLGIVIAVVVLAAIVFFYMLTSGFFTTHTTAAVIGEHKLSPAMVNYYYRDAYNYFSQQYSQLLSYLIDTSVSLDEQVYDEESGATWADYFVDSGLQNAAQMYALYDDAKANGFELSETELSNIDSQISTMEMYAGYYGYSDADAFIAASYGTGCNAKSYREYLLVNTTAEAYATMVNDSYNYSADDLSAEYAANPNDYDGITYRVFSFYHSWYTDENGEALEDEEAAKLAAADAEKMAADTQGDEEAFKQACIDNASETLRESYETNDTSLRTDVSYDSMPEAIADWLMDAERKEGDTTFAAADTGCYVVYYLSRDTHDYGMPNVRHILFSVSDSTDEDEVATAQASAEGVLADFEANETTEDAFAALGDQLYEDGAASEAAKYENIYPGQMVSAFEDWCYDASREVGDTGIVESDYGFHVMYFCGRGDNLRDYLVETALRSADYSEWESGVLEGATYETTSAIRYASK